MNSILFLFFNRPETAGSVFAKIRVARPERLFLAADGPRSTIAGDAELCQKTRASVEGLIDWPCEVHRLYRDINLGCREAVSSAIDWFFSHVEEGIILEDDTLPDPSFFHFANAMLERYRKNPVVMHISGNNYQDRRIRGSGSYYYSQWAHSWGWATWRRAWKHYCVDISGFEQDWDSLSADLAFSRDRKCWWFESLKGCASGTISTWDFQWHYAIMKQQGLCLIPQMNLVKNIGVGSAATHTHSHTNTTLTQASSLRFFTAPSMLNINHDWDEFDFTHSVMNRPYPRLSLWEWINYRKFIYKNSK
jgi:hypothetical protein